ncbi:MAG: DUF262 domain-containing protein [Spirochaetaceae bacterium]|jgi:hypothetical protein|nr:DUF262 domain-containing protein [Spirochaetaceae bacterium]
MTIELHEIPVKDLVDGYVDHKEEGVIGWGGRLNIRPPYQREFVYKDAQRDAVIETVRKGFPLNVMYWVKNGENYEVLDGQQRTISICRYVSGDFQINAIGWNNLTSDQREQILDYRLMVYFCEGAESEKLAWFRIVNIAGEKLTEQELKNATYTGPWLADAKRHFSKTGCAAYNLAKDYVNGSPIRQEYLETALDWISCGKIEAYMAEHQRKPSALPLWQYFQGVMTWVEEVFPKYRKEMKGVPWGVLYNKYKDKTLDPAGLEKEVSRLMADDDVTNKRGVYPYVLGEDEKHLSIRAFTASQKRAAYERQQGACPLCNGHFDINEMEGDHTDPWHAGGKTTADNCRMLCKPCNRRKAGK